jgi:radical SAM protein with 4Fe4S-binding SPASM domain
MGNALNLARGLPDGGMLALPRVPLTCFWEITAACNLRCVHCEADAGRRAPAELSTEEALALAGDLALAGCRGVRLTGGEPLLRPDWPLLARRLTGFGVEVTLITNGLLLDGETLARAADAGVTGVAISLDGRREVHDALRLPAAAGTSSRHAAARRALELVAASPLRAAAITQIHRDNLADLQLLYEDLAGLGVEVWQVQLAMPLGRLLRHRDAYLVRPADLPALEEQLAVLVADGRVRLAVADNIGYYGRREPILRGALHGVAAFWTGCQAGCRLVGIGPSGEVKGCPSHPPAFVAGNVRAEPFAAIWGDAGRFAYNTAWREDLLVGGCARCSFRRLCRAGCTSMAFSVTGTIHDNPFCLQRAQASGDGPA